MTTEQIEQELAGCVAPMIGLDSASEVDVTAHLMELGLDSLGLVEIFVFIEKRFKLKLLDAGITRKDMESLRALAAYISGKLA